MRRYFYLPATVFISVQRPLLKYGVAVAFLSRYNFNSTPGTGEKAEGLLNGKNMSREEHMVKTFNELYKEGDTIKLAADDGQIFEATVSHGAHLLGGHTPVVYVKEGGSYSLERMRSPWSKNP